MKGKLSFIISLLLLSLCFTVATFGQETMGSLQGTIKDPNGAVIPNATVIAKNDQRSFTATTNAAGEYTFNNLPAGVYVIDVTAQGFGPLRRESFPIEVGRVLQLNFDMKTAGVDAVVEVVGNDPIVDVSSTQTATNITQREIEVLPKGLRFSSVIEVAPGTRGEPKSNGFQIDGATGSENVWVIDGLEVTRTFGGSLGSTKNIPLEFVSEVQVKSAGYEAEFGGALGGVIGVVSRSGGNEFHGGVGLEMDDSAWNANNRLTRRYSRQGLAAGQRIVDYYAHPDGKDDSSTNAPRFTVGGPIWKNKVWFYAGYAPEYSTTKRTIRLISPVTASTVTPTVLQTRDLTARSKNDNMFARVDASPFSKLSVYVSAFNTPSKSLGAFPAGSVNQGSFEWPSNVTNSPFFDARLPYRGGFTPANSVSGQAVYSLLENLIFSVKMGRNYLNDKGGNYDIDTSNPVWSIVSPCGPPIVGCPANTTSAATIGTANSATSYDITTRKNFQADVTWVKRLFGQQHNIKGGFQRNKVTNSVLAASGGTVSIFFNQSDPQTNRRGTYGYYTVAQTGTIGDAASQNDAFFVQDSWQFMRRLTLNLGIRTERETVPSFGFGALPPAIVFGYGDKFAPRLGAALDVFGNGKLKIWGSYAVFFDTMKYDMPRGSFGGETQIVDHRALDTFDFLSINRTNQPGALFVREDQRTVSTEDYVLGNRVFPGIDPDLKPTREHAYTFGADYAFSRNLVFSGRFTRKVLDRTIDDVGIPSEHFENYCICNPGFGASAATQAFGYPATPKAVREYTGMEFTVDKRFSNNWYVNATYLWSRLYGNYSGLASSDESGRGNPNVNRFFDVPWINDTALGTINNGLLATDRPHTLKVFAGYNFEYNLFGKKMNTLFGANQYIYQGTPLSSTVQIQLNGTLEDGSDCSGGGCNHGVSMLINGRGDLGRTDTYTQTDMQMTHRFFFNENIAFKFGVNVFNLWNEANELDRSVALIRANTPAIANEYNTPAAVLQYGTAANTLSQSYNIMRQTIGNYQTQHAATLASFKNPFYNLPILWQGPRTIRLSVGLQF